MSNLSSYLRMEVLKYKDIEHIFAKLEQDGEIDKIHEVFRSIFVSESEFTIGELLKIEKEKGEHIHIREQYKNNVSLFKNNLLLIVQMIIENAFKNVVTENNQKLKEMRNQTNPLDTAQNTTQEAPEDQEALSGTGQFENSQELRNTYSILQKDSVKSNGSSAQKATENSKTKKGRPNSAFSNMMSSSNSTNQQNVSGSEKRQNTATFGHKKTVSNLAANRINSPLNQILHGSPRTTNKDSAKGLSHNISNSSIKPYTTTNQSYASHKHNLSTSSVQSEFNHIRGSATFSTSKKKSIMDVDINNPGPGQYHTDRCSPSNLRRSPSPTIGKAPKGSWLDICGQGRTESPGPGGLYPSMHFVKK